MAKITAELGTVAKNLNVQAGKGTSYKAVSERDVLDAVKPMEEKYGVYSYPCSRETLESERLESETEVKDYKTGETKIAKKTTFYTRLKTTYRFVNIEKPEEYTETTVFSVGLDSQDKGDGKAMTYGDKYALMKQYKISTGDDPDQEGIVDTDYRKAKKSATDKKADAESLIQRDCDAEYFICPNCGKPNHAFAKKDGSIMTPREMLDMSIKDFGKPLCKDCYKKALGR